MVSLSELHKIERKVKTKKLLNMSFSLIYFIRKINFEKQSFVKSREFHFIKNIKGLKTNKKMSIFNTYLLFHISIKSEKSSFSGLKTQFSKLINAFQPFSTFNIFFSEKWFK